MTHTGIDIYFIDTPYVERFQYPDGSYKPDSVIVATSMYSSAKGFTEEIERYKESGYKELFIYDYQWKEIKYVNDVSFNKLWVRRAFKK